jgi:hypothetical protein
MHPVCGGGVCRGGELWGVGLGGVLLVRWVVSSWLGGELWVHYKLLVCTPGEGM